VRVKYSDDILEEIKEQIHLGKLSTSDRLGIIRDLFALAEGGYIQTIVALEFSLTYKNENEYIVWSEIASGLNRVYNIVVDESFKKEYKNMF